MEGMPMRPTQVERPVYTDPAPVTPGVPAATESAASERRTAVTWPAWSPSQFISLVVAVLTIVVGGVALARAGVTLSNVPEHRSTVLGLGFTSMSALITLVVGVIIAIGCIDPYANRMVSGGFGVAFLAFGLVVAITPHPFLNMWNFTTANGVVIILAGVVLILSALLSPVFARSTATTARRRSVA